MLHFHQILWKLTEQLVLLGLGTIVGRSFAC